MFRITFGPNLQANASQNLSFCPFTLNTKNWRKVTSDNGQSQISAGEHNLPAVTYQDLRNKNNHLNVDNIEVDW